MSATDQEILLAVGRGSDAAARELWSRHAGRLLAFLRCVLPRGGPIEADDVLQQTFCRVLETSQARLREVRDVPGWLFQVARNIAFNAGRGEKRERSRRGAAQEPGSRRAGPVVLDGSAHDGELARALAGLMPDLRDVVLLRHVAGLTFDQIEVATQTNRNTAASRYRSAIRLLEIALSQPDSETPGVTAGALASGRVSTSTEVSHG